MDKADLDDRRARMIDASDARDSVMQQTMIRRDPRGGERLLSFERQGNQRSLSMNGRNCRLRAQA
jgi:hypothetical protein